jgi:hypothetical protein
MEIVELSITNGCRNPGNTRSCGKISINAAQKEQDFVADGAEKRKVSLTANGFASCLNFEIKLR